MNKEKKNISEDKSHWGYKYFEFYPTEKKLLQNILSTIDNLSNNLAEAIKNSPVYSYLTDHDNGEYIKKISRPLFDREKQLLMGKILDIKNSRVRDLYRVYNPEKHILKLILDPRDEARKRKEKGEEQTAQHLQNMEQSGYPINS